MEKRDPSGLGWGEVQVRWGRFQLLHHLLGAPVQPPGIVLPGTRLLPVPGHLGGCWILFSTPASSSLESWGMACTPESTS